MDTSNDSEEIISGTQMESEGGEDSDDIGDYDDNSIDDDEISVSTEDNSSGN